MGTASIAIPPRSVNARNRPGRIVGLDASRGLAVLLMVAWHVADAWLADAHRETALWDLTRVAGGLAAPLFLAAAGATATLRIQRDPSSFRAVVRRGMAVLMLGLLLRIQIWWVDAGALPDPTTWVAAGALTAAAALLLLRALDRVGAHVTALAIALFVLGAWRLVVDAPERAALVLRFDVLHCIGVSVIACAFVARFLPRGSELALALAAVLASQIDLPWIARGPMTTFGLAPFAGYALLGCAAVRLRVGRPTRVLAIAIAVAALAFEGGFPFVRRALHDHPELRPFARFAFSSASCAALAALAFVSRDRRLAMLGRRSLVVYWVHVSVVFGVVSLPLHRALGPWACLAAATSFVAVAIVSTDARVRVLHALTPFWGSSIHRRTNVHDSAFRERALFVSTSRLQHGRIRGSMTACDGGRTGFVEPAKAHLPRTP